jgi:hypothetical protein
VIAFVYATYLIGYLDAPSNVNVFSQCHRLLPKDDAARKCSMLWSDTPSRLEDTMKPLTRQTAFRTHLRKYWHRFFQDHVRKLASISNDLEVLWLRYWILYRRYVVLSFWIITTPKRLAKK